MEISANPTGKNIPEHLLCSALPQSMRDLLQYVPMQAVLAMAEAYGGTTLYIPLHPQPDAGLAKLIGIQAAKSLASHAGGTTLEIPRLTKAKQRAKHAAVLDSLACGASQKDTARAFGLSVRQVRNISNGYTK